MLLLNADLFLWLRPGRSLLEGDDFVDLRSWVGRIKRKGGLRGGPWAPGTPIWGDRFVVREVRFKLDDEPSSSHICGLELSGDIHDGGDGSTNFPSEARSEMRPRLGLLGQ